MNCKNINKSLWAYIEKELSARDIKEIQQHLKNCTSCREEYESMLNYQKELKVLKKVKAPSDLLENVHNRLEESFWSRLFQKVFVPFKYKIPLELAGLMITVLLIWIILPQTKKIGTLSKGSDETVFTTVPKKVLMEKKRGDNIISGEKLKNEAEKDSLMDKLGDRESVTRSLTGGMKKKKGKESADDLVEVILLFDSNQPVKLKKAEKQNQKDYKKKAPATLGVYNVKPAEESVDKTEYFNKEDYDDVGNKESGKVTANTKIPSYSQFEIYTQVTNITRQYKGRVLQKEYGKTQSIPQSVVVELPTNNYVSFINELNRIGEIQQKKQLLKRSRKRFIQNRIQFQERKAKIKK